MFEWFGVLVAEFGKEVAMGIGVLYGGWKFKRLKSILGGLAASVGFGATVMAIVAGVVVVGAAVGWISLDIGQALGDLGGLAGGAWDLFGEDLLGFVGDPL